MEIRKWCEVTFFRDNMHLLIQFQDNLRVPQQSLAIYRIEEGEPNRSGPAAGTKQVAQFL